MATSDRNDWLSLELWNWSITPQGCWTVACGMFNVAWWGRGSQKSTFSCSVHWAKTASWASADDEWLHSVDAVGASCFYSSVTDVEACASFLHRFMKRVLGERSLSAPTAVERSPNQVKDVTWWPSPGWFLNCKHLWATHIQLADSHLLKVDRSQRSSSAVLQIERKKKKPWPRISSPCLKKLSTQIRRSVKLVEAPAVWTGQLWVCASFCRAVGRPFVSGVKCFRARGPSFTVVHTVN